MLIRLMNDTISKIRRVVVTLRFSILSVFILFFILAMITIISIVYVRFSDSMSAVSFALMRRTSYSVFQSIRHEIESILLQSQLAAYLVKSEALHPSDQQSLMKYAFYSLKLETPAMPNSVQSILWGDEAGNFVMAIKNKDGSITSGVIDRAHPSHPQQIAYYDLSGDIAKYVKSAPTHYDPRQRPWYQEAKKENKSIWTDVYSDAITTNLEITTATPVFKRNGQLEGVFAAEMRLDYLRQFIESMRISTHGVVYIVGNQGQLIAFPYLTQYKDATLMNVHQLSIPWVIASFDYYQKTKLQKFSFIYEGNKYLATYQSIPFMDQYGWVIGIVVPQSDFTQELVKAKMIIIASGLMILVLGIVFMSNLVTRIVSSLKKLVQETEKIKHFELEETVHIQSRIKEIMILSDAIYAMRQGLRSFQKYVPATLVRQLIESGKDALIGGEKKQLAIFFSDIEDFTTITESTDPNQLITSVCEYFNALSHIISDTKGTIDKYIGDALMVFWGAPLPQKQSCQKAAYAALRCLECLTELNAKWAAQGGLFFNTRIGLHFGEATVGNIGSNERFNYTAIGDVVNMTSRLESVNKLYGTRIATSEAFYHMVKEQFALRFLDCVALKGKTEDCHIYELLGERADQLPFDLDAYQSIFISGFSAYRQQQWDRALEHFRHCLKIYAEDTLAPVFIERCEYFKQHPPPPGWNGVWRMQDK